MVLSSYFDWGTDVQNVNTEPIYQSEDSEPVQAPQLVAGDDEYQHLLQHYWDTSSYDQLPYAFLDPYVDLNNKILHPQNYTPFLPYEPSISFSSPENEIIPYEKFSSYHYPKRQKLIEDQYCCSDFVPAFFDGVAPNFSPMPEDQSMKHQINDKKMSSEKSVSVQSIAARERRRKITEKTQELGKIVPGGNKMNTAEMLQAAFKYIKYLQAQVGILQVMDSFADINEKASCRENYIQMVTSPKVQEKLYMEDKCLVPKDFVLCLTTISKPPLSDELTRLLPLSPHH